MTDFLVESEARYREASERRDAIRDAWVAEGAPLLTNGSTGQLVEHPLVKMLREHDLLVDKLSKELKAAHRGPNPAAVVSATIGKSPAAKLRRVS